MKFSDLPIGATFKTSISVPAIYCKVSRKEIAADWNAVVINGLQVGFKYKNLILDESAQVYPMTNIIAACSDNLAIGKDNELPWPREKGDLNTFQRLTNGGTVIMGRQTFDSIGKPLTNRQNIVVTSQDIVGVQTARTLSSAIFLSNNWPIWLIGGHGIYEEGLRLGIVAEIFLGRIRGHYDGDVFFDFPLDYPCNKYDNIEIYFVGPKDKRWRKLNEIS